MRVIAETQPVVFGRGLIQNLEELEMYVPLGLAVEEFWRNPNNRQATSWLEHLDINSVMLATSLLPDEFLAL